MKNFFLFGASILLIAGCTASRSTGGNDYGYTFDMPLPTVSGTQAQLTAAMNAPSSGYATTESGGQTHGPASQSVVFYEGSQPTQGVVAAGTPVWTSPVAPAPAPGYVPGTGAPVVNEPAGAAVGANAAGAPMAAEAPAPYYYGDGGSAFIAGTNGVTNGGGINISNSNVIGFPTNGLTNVTGTNRFTTNTTVTTNGNTVVTSNVVTSNMVATTPTNAAGTPIAPVAGATNNLNNLPRAAAPTAGNPSGTQLINQRPLGEAPTPTQSQALHTPTQPGPTTTEAAGAATTGTGTTTGDQNDAAKYDARAAEHANNSASRNDATRRRQFGEHTSDQRSADGRINRRDRHRGSLCQPESTRAFGSATASAAAATARAGS